MPTTPQVNFNFVNENVQASTPLLGVTHVLARTTRGKFNSPDTLITSWPQFQRIYGEEIVPDGSVSNIKKALELGSKLRISRVAGNHEEPAYGYAKLPGENEDVPASFRIRLIDPVNSENSIRIELKIRTAEPGSSVLDTTGDNLNRTFYLRLQVEPGPNNKITLIQAKNPSFTSDSILDSRPLFMASKYDSTSDTNPTPFIDPETLHSFIKSVPFIELELEQVIDQNSEEIPAYSNSGMEGVISLLKTHSNWYAQFVVGNSPTITSSSPLVLTINEGNSGGPGAPAKWVEAYDAIKGYTDSYQLILSHIHQHFTAVEPGDDRYISVYKIIAEEVAKHFDEVLYVEVPKYNADNKPMTPNDMKVWLETNVPIIGSHKTTAYFGGGIKYYDDNGSLQDCDVLGTVVGLGDRSASNNGPWFSFAGMNRGVVVSANGPVVTNLGGSGYVSTLQTLADWYLNLFVVKDTRTQGKRTMLWHSFTSNPINNSEKFLSIVRLNLYLKKNLLPILESYIEEPNIWDTWKLIYYEAKEILDDLVSRGAMSEYTWQGDQFATSYEELVVNKEADVRQGKYRIKLRYKDIVPMQEIGMDIIIDSASKDISISTTE